MRWGLALGLGLTLLGLALGCTKEYPTTTNVSIIDASDDTNVPCRVIVNGQVIETDCR